MKYLELKEQLLNEINMSPNALRRAAKEIGAKAGMEFEMIVKGAAESEEGDDYREPDMDSDESINSIQDAFDFYYDGDFNSRRDAQDLVDRMRNDYTEWLGGQFESRWDSDMTEFVYRWLRNNADENDIAEILGKEFDEENVISKQDYIDAADKVVADQIDPWYDDAYQDASDDFYNDTDLESEWLEDQGITTMWDVQDNYSITWPHYYNPDTSGGDVSVEDAADSFSRAIGRPVEASGNYHSRSVKRPDAENLHYVVEPDGSLEADEDGDGGLEFVSPALPIDELLDDLKKVKAWADKSGNYTNDSTGLHINVSVPKWQGDLSKLDYVKLAILMGDEYVLQEFGRSGNSYAKSALKIVKDNIRQRPEDVARLLDTMKQHLNTSAAKLIHSGSTSKYTSVNTKDGYIEFRSPGGDWLNENFDKIESTLLRFVVAMDAAVDETKYKEEYAKKLYKLLAGDQKDTTNTMAYFAKYAAGELPQSALKSFIKQAQFERSQSKQPNGKKMWYRVDKEGRGASNGASIEVIATSKEEALEKAASEWMVKLSSLTAAAAYPVRAYEEPRVAPYDPDGKFIISKFKADGPNTVAYRFNADTRNKADWVLTAWLTANNITNRDDVRKYSIRYDPEKNEGQAPGHETSNQPRYEIFNLNTNNSVEDAEGITNDRDALIRLNDYLEHGPHRLTASQARNVFGIRRVGASEPILAQPAGSSYNALSQTDIENRLGWGSQAADANYEMVDRRTNRPVFKFIANTDQDALRKYTQVLDVFGFPHDTEVYGYREIGRSEQPSRQTTTGPRTDRPFVWKVIGSSQSPYQSQGTEVVATSEIEAMQKARQQWNLNTSGASEEEFFRTNGWRATPIRPAPVQGSTQDLQQQRAQGGFTGAWKVLDGLGREVYRFSGVGNSQSDANRVAADWMRQHGQGGNFEVVPVIG